MKIPIGTAAAMIFTVGCAHPPKVDLPAAARMEESRARLEGEVKRAKIDGTSLLAPREVAWADRYLIRLEEDGGRARQELAYAQGALIEGAKFYAQRSGLVRDVLEAREGAVREGANQFDRTSAELAALDTEVRRRAASLDRGREEPFWSRLREDYEQLRIQTVVERNLAGVRELVEGAREGGARLYAPGALRFAERQMAEAELAVRLSPRKAEGFRESVERAQRAADYLTVANSSARAVARAEVVDYQERPVGTHEELMHVKGLAGD